MKLIDLEALVSVDLDPSKGGLDRKLNRDRGAKPYIVQEDELVVAPSDERLTSIVGTCAGFYGRGRRGDRDVLVFAHLDVEVSERKLKTKIDRMRKALSSKGVKLSSSLLDLSPYTGPGEVEILRQSLGPVEEVPIPQDTQERVVTLGWDAIEVEFHTRKGDHKRTLEWGAQGGSSTSDRSMRQIPVLRFGEIPAKR